LANITQYFLLQEPRTRAIFSNAIVSLSGINLTMCGRQPDGGEKKAKRPFEPFFYCCLLHQKRRKHHHENKFTVEFSKGTWKVIVQSRMGMELRPQQRCGELFITRD
jgi:hypothetical protein